MSDRLHIIDSHTEGEPTRVVIEGWPTLHGETMIGRRDDARARYDHLRAALIREPRGHDAIVGAILTPPVSAGSAAGVIFCNDIGYLGMCGHGTIGVVRTLAHLGRISSGEIRLDTPAGTVSATLHDDGDVTIENVASYCYATNVRIDVPGIGEVVGDVAYGGNWFFLTKLAKIALRIEHIDELLCATTAIRTALRTAGITGEDRADIDHIELHGPAVQAHADARNFVLCPGAAYDRSPCGTGTSAMMATLYHRGQLELETPWAQESIIGSCFTGSLTKRGDALIPSIRGRAFVTATATLHLDPADPYRYGIAP